MRAKKSKSRTSATAVPRHRLWSKSQFLQDLEKHGEIKKVCEIYAFDSKWRANYTDVRQWRKEDPEFDAKVLSIISQFGNDRTQNGRPRKDENDKSWQVDYCEALVSGKLSLEAAASATPYSIRQIQEFLNPNYTSYDEEFAKMVEEAELRVSSKARVIMAEGLEPEAYADFETAKITQTKLWAAHKALEKLEPKRFGRKVEVSGTVQYQHQHRLMAPNDRIAMLLEDRQKFMEAKRKQMLLASGDRPEMSASGEDVLDAEVIEASGRVE